MYLYVFMCKMEGSWTRMNIMVLGRESCACAVACGVFKYGLKIPAAQHKHLSSVRVTMIWAISSLAVGIATLLLIQRKFYPYFWHDLMYFARVRRVGSAMKARMKRGFVTYLQCFELQARNSPEKPFIVFEEQILSYRDADARSNRFASVLKSHCGLKHGDTVALLMSNEADFICVWFGLCKLGCEVAFLNFNIKSQSLQHCLRSCGAKALVIGSGKRHRNAQA